MIPQESTTIHPEHSFYEPLYLEEPSESVSFLNQQLNVEQTHGEQQVYFKSIVQLPSFDHLENSLRSLNQQ